jgi:hypothetical protein
MPTVWPGANQFHLVPRPKSDHFAAMSDPDGGLIDEGEYFGYRSIDLNEYESSFALKGR